MVIQWYSVDNIPPFSEDTRMSPLSRPQTGNENVESTIQMSVKTFPLLENFAWCLWSVSYRKNSAKTLMKTLVRTLGVNILAMNCHKF